MTRPGGRFGLGPNDPICPRRGTCLRRLAMFADDERWPNGYPPYVHVSTGLCEGGSDHYIDQEARAGHISC